MNFTQSDMKAFKKILKDELKNFATKDDLKTSKNDVVDKIFKHLDENFTTKEEFQELREQIRLLPKKEEFFAKMDEIIGEMKKIREEHPVLASQVSSRSNRLEKLEKIHPSYKHASV